MTMFPCRCSCCEKRKEYNEILSPISMMKSSSKKINDLKEKNKYLWGLLKDACGLIAGLQVSHQLHGDNNKWANRVLNPYNDLYKKIEIDKKE